MKPGLPFAALALAAALCACGGEKPSIPEEYSALVDKVYITKKPLLVYSHGGFEGGLEVPGEGGTPELTEIEPAFPQRRGGNTIFGLLPAGSRIKVASVYTDWSTRSGWDIEFRFKVIEPHEFSSLSIWDIGLMDYDRAPLKPKAELFLEEPLPPEPAGD
ncbi:MAG: hypothetical protein RQ748_08360 [Elusimicrobiales bacterium]|nr:hypothetical protein [Elusimicrobiales bacterium]